MESEEKPDGGQYAISEILRRNTVPRPDSAPIFWYSRSELAARTAFCGLSLVLSLFLISWVAGVILVSSVVVVIAGILWRRGELRSAIRRWLHLDRSSLAGRD